MRVYAFLALLFPVCLIGFSWIIAELIPGCKVDEGAGATTACGAIGSFLEFGILGGFLWLIFGLLGLIPALSIYVLANKKSTSQAPRNFLYKGFEEAVEEEQAELKSK